MNVIDKITASQLNPNIPEFRVGDTVRVDVKIIEGKRERRHGSDVSETFTVRKMSYGVGVERTFPVHSPKLANITVVKTGKARRAKLYYLRDRKSDTKFKERG